MSRGTRLSNLETGLSSWPVYLLFIIVIFLHYCLFFLTFVIGMQLSHRKPRLRNEPLLSLRTMSDTFSLGGPEVVAGYFLETAMFDSERGGKLTATPNWPVPRPLAVCFDLYNSLNPPTIPAPLSKSSTERGM